MQFCPDCGIQNSATARFCANCGHSLQGQGAPAVGLPPPSVTPVMPPVQSAGSLTAHSILQGRYRILRLITQGGMGAVYLAQDQKAFDRRCVVKEMLPYYTTPAEKKKAEMDFEREARLLSSLHLDGIPTIYEYFIEQGNYYLVMEYFEGENLEQRLQRMGGSLPVDEVLKYALQLANTLVYMGKQTPPVIHRDIKPANIILDQDQDQVKLVDFGLAKEFASATGMTGTLSAPLGTPGYAPMEQYSNHVEPRTDIYALGATLHHLLSGRDPRNETAFDFPPLRQFVPGIPPAMEELVARMVATRVGDRPNAVEVRDTLEGIIAPTPKARAALGGQQAFAFRSGAVAYDPNELAILCDQDWEDGIYHLYAGHFEPWLEAINRRDLAVRAESIRARNGNQSAGLEEFLRAANPTIPLPSLALSASDLDLGMVEKGKSATASLRIKNAGRGCLYGRVVAKSRMVTVRPSDFSLMAGEEAALTVVVESGTLPEGAATPELFEVTSNGGRADVRGEMEVTWQPALQVEPRRRLALGDVEEANPQPVSGPLLIRNVGGGTLQARIVSDLSWISVDQSDLTVASGDSATVLVTASLSQTNLQRQSGALRIETALGTQEVMVQVGVRRDEFDEGVRLQRWLIYGSLMVIGYVGMGWSLAMIPWLAMTGSSLSWLSVLGLAFGYGASLGAFLFSRRWVGEIDEIENYFAGVDLAAELPVGHFSWRRLGGAALLGALFGALLGWRFAEASQLNVLLWLLVGMAAAAAGGALLAAVGKPSPTLPVPFGWMTRLWQGATMESSPTFTAIRSGGLVWVGATLGAMLSSFYASEITILSALWGGMLGLIASSESHHSVALRVQWLLRFGRALVVTGIGASFAISLPFLLRFGAPWPILPTYGYIVPTFYGFITLLWNGLLVIFGFAGGLGGLYLLDGLGHGWSQARRLFYGFVLILLGIAFPFYLVMSAVGGLFLPPIWRSWLVILITAGAGGAFIYALYAHRSTIEATGAAARRQMGQGVARLPQVYQSGRQQIQKVSGQLVVPSWVQTNWQRVRGMRPRYRLPAHLSSLPKRLTPPLMAQLEQDGSLALALSGLVTALILLPQVTQLLVSAAVGLGIVLLYAALLIALVVGVAWGVRYLRNRP